MKTEKACGAIIYRQNQEGNTEVLLVKQQNGLTGFPKGHMEPGETEQETAKREVLEETSLAITLLDGPRFEFDYIIPAHAHQSSHASVGEPIHKVVVLFLATLSGEATAAGRPQASEISELLWLPVEKVETALTYPEWRAVWQEARSALTTHISR